MQVLLGKAMEAWSHMRLRRMDLASTVDMVSSQRRMRIKASVLDVWRSYTVAMRRNLDPRSPFLAPRSPQDDHNLIRHVASSLVGGKKVIKPIAYCVEGKGDNLHYPNHTWGLFACMNTEGHNNSNDA
jgi:hypothetical protein